MTKSDTIDEQPRRAITSDHEVAQTDKPSRSASGEIVVPKKRRGESAEQRAARKAAKRASRVAASGSGQAVPDTHESKASGETGWEKFNLARKLERQERREADLAAATAAAAKKGDGAIELFGIRTNQHGYAKSMPLKPKMSTLVQECLECGDTEAHRYHFALKGHRTWLLICHKCYCRVWAAERRLKGSKNNKHSVHPYYGARSDYIFQGKLDNVPY
ncbi:hypothetical protein CERZMDRAFT_90655 [Cercospora zeae-maydis SCOH1-5]|uniref:Uncharacterized protein n=1 Tax=Cercospora zeae-maydis SCOH1-5 TaxID=717836 RepID=A0A6A6FHC6_9PEZI|nr:hypothetical protein CERZMDRAFT_90655 [Cercospora zeae-maydis SCOH1-5]